MPVTIRPTDGAIVLNGAPFFPIGLYHVSHYPADDARRLVDLGWMARAGCNTICTPLTLANGPTFLEWCSKMGIWAIVENNDPQGIEAMAKALKGRPGLLGWQVFDDLGNGKHTPEQVLALHNKLKAIDPGALTYSSFGGDRRIFGTFVGCVDILAAQTYPIPAEHPSSTSNYLDTCTRAASASKRAVIANCQAYQWPGQRPPSPEEVRSMTYRAIHQRVKGVIWYTCYDPAFSLRDSGLAPTVEALAGELKAMSPGLLAGTL